MPKSPFMPKDDSGKLFWMSNFAAKLAALAATVGVSTAEAESAQADSDFFSYVCDARNQYTQKAQEWTAYKNALRNGESLGILPVAPTLATAPAAVEPDIFGRLAALASRIKKHPGYTEAIGQNLGIIGPDQTFDPGTAKPVLKVTLEAGHPNVGWKKQGMDGLEIWVDRGTGAFAFLALDTVPDYLDTAPLPAAGTSAVWKYKAIYRLNDEQVGEWSDVASISVMG